jgi:hypothetical protein
MNKKLLLLNNVKETAIDSYSKRGFSKCLKTVLLNSVFGCSRNLHSDLPSIHCRSFHVQSVDEDEQGRR